MATLRTGALHADASTAADACGCASSSTSGPGCGGPTDKFAQGETRTYTFVVRDVDDALVDLTGALVFFTVRERFESADPPLIQKRTVSAGGVVGEVDVPTQTDAGLGRVVVNLVPADTTSLATGVAFVADLWVQRGTDVRRAYRMTITLEPRVTHVP